LVAFCQFNFGVSLREKRSTKRIRKARKQRKDKKGQGRTGKVNGRKDQARKG